MRCKKKKHSANLVCSVFLHSKTLLICKELHSGHVPQYKLHKRNITCCQLIVVRTQTFQETTSLRWWTRLFLVGPRVLFNSISVTYSTKRRSRIEWLTLLLRIRRVQGSNLVPQTGYPDSGFPWFSSVSPGKCWDTI
jgi:hypothetical protein